MLSRISLYIASLLLLLQCSNKELIQYDILIRNATIYDGSGEDSFDGMLGINADTIAAVGSFKNASGKLEIDAQGMAVSPGFINMLSWATRSLIQDGRGMSDIKQGVTLEVMGEGTSMGPLNDDMKAQMSSLLDGLEIPWTTLGEYLQYLEQKGVSPNVASFVGATTLRMHEMGYENRSPTSTELENMKKLTRQAMEEGAMGIGSSLIYAPAFYADTRELIEICKEASKYDGMYITHLRSEANKFLEAIDEVIEIAIGADIPAEIYHLKAGGKENWHKMDLAIDKINEARKDGLTITTDMYTYTAGSTGLDAAMPPAIQEGGYEAWVKRLKDPKQRPRIKEAMKTNAQDWENLYYHAGPENVLLVGFKNEELRKQYTGKTVAEVAAIRGTDTEETAMDLVIEDGSRVQVVYFLMSEDNIKKQLKLPYLSFGSDAGAPAAEGDFLKTMTHPRAYGNFARLLGKYVREEKVIPLKEAIRKLTSLPASNLKIEKRGLLQPGYYADIVIFNPDTIKDNATYQKPHQYADGVIHVFVNGGHVLRNGEHTGATPGRFVKGPGWQQQ